MRLNVPRPSAAPRLDLYAAMQQASEPFAPPVISRIAATTAVPSASAVPAILLAAWLCGVLLVFVIWYLRWRRVHASVREAAPLSQGRGWEALRRLERAEKLPRSIDIFLSHTSLEPGIFGIAKPVLLWPNGISERLDDAHLHAVLAHELWHVRRRDNLAAALHMFVEALFWFNPVVWWMGLRLLNERERACDEAVLESGGDRQVYAESILKICEFCVGSPLPCVSGVTSADLKQRITRIMSERFARKLDLGRKLLLGAAAVLAVAAPIAAGILHITPDRSATSQIGATTAAEPTFASVVITPSKPSSILRPPELMLGPGKFRSGNAPLQQVIRAAYNVEDDRIIGAPAWLDSDKYDFEAQAGDSAADNPSKRSVDQLISENGRMLQQALADRLKLALHRETRELSVFALVLAKDGPKLQEATPGDTYPNGFKSRDGVTRTGIRFDRSNHMIAQGVPVAALVRHSEMFLNRTVIDETGLSGSYDFTLQIPPLPPIEASPRILSAALEQDLGLQLEPRRVAMEVLVIDHVERPVETHAQSPTAAPAIPAFQLISAKANKSGSESSNMNVSLLPGDASSPTGGLVSGTNVPLISYINFAYHLTGNQLQLLLPNVPNWLINDRFDLQAKAAGNNLSNDQLRLVTQAVLADRFHLAAHYETRQLPVYALVLAKPGATGPQLNPHAGNPPCPSAPLNDARSPYPATVKGGLPADCGRIEPLLSSRLRVGARNVPIGLLASTLPQLGNLDRPVVNHSGLGGSYDFTLEVSPQRQDRAHPRGVEPTPGFVRDLHDQLGLQLEPQTGSTEIFVIDHVEKPSAN